MLIESILEKYSFSKQDINYIGSVEPVKTKSLMSYLNKRLKNWGYYFVEWINTEFKHYHLISVKIYYFRI